MNRRALQGAMRGLMAAAIYFIVILLLVGLGNLYGLLFAIDSELPVLLTLPFWLSLPVAVLALPAAGAAIAAGGPSTGSPGRPVLAGGFIGLLAVIGIFFLTSGSGALLDWPGLLYLLQMAMAAFVAAALLPVSLPDSAAARADEAGSPAPGDMSGAVRPGRAGAAGPGPASAAGYGRRQLGYFGRLALVWAGVSLLLLAVPFLLLWSGKRAFEADGASRAGVTYVLPPGAGFTVRHEGSRVESLGVNKRYTATYSLREDGQEFTVTVFGDRERFSVAPGEVSATLNITDPGVVQGVGWQNLSSNREDLTAALLAIAQAYVNKPLALAAVRTDQTAPEVRFRGEGVEVVVRPNGSAQAPIGLFFSFRALD